MYLHTYTYVHIYMYSYIYMEEGNGNSLQYSCLENSVDRGAWWTAVHGVAQSQARLKQFGTHTHTHTPFSNKNMK